MRLYNNRNLLIITFLLFACSCNKYLDKKPNSLLYVPDKWEDLQAILDLNVLFNFQPATSLVEILADDYYALTEQWQNVSTDLSGSFIWNDLSSQFEDGWYLPYKAIYTSNVVLDQLNKIEGQVPLDKANNIEGTALFYRSNSFYSLLQIYCKPYSSTAETDVGIVIKTTGSITETVSRASVDKCYKQVIDDLKKSIDLLPARTENVMRPSKSAARALLSRIYLSMSDFDNSGLYARQALQDNSSLIDFNELVPEEAPLMPAFLSNPEIIFFSFLDFNDMVSPIVVNIDSSLYRSYNNNDLRKKVYFAPSLLGTPDAFYFQGCYFESFPFGIFNGLTTDEMYLILAESSIRKGEIDQGIGLLNTLLKKRYKTGSFVEYTTLSQDEALRIVLIERRKELIFRGLRWSDIRRFNVEGKNITLKRVLDGKEYLLPAKDLRSVMLIPNSEITRSGISQNPR